ncbi:hypothetical protein [Streptomyces qinzhouensis]|uniref:Uncharacterized protein n=1 Tax=Streptomyces qinzhouensis TaxID=2599401 RepID=A0A5B8J4Y2_9ACTN|nr:hypothetical protein [Streptomyces qinzhouensis]QDY75434.1 hypothetical protein FQU76_01715 [Streptomyces qinzhouensis]
MNTWWNRFYNKRQKRSPRGSEQLSAVPREVSASGDGSVAVGGSAEIIVAGSHNALTIHLGSAGPTSLDELADAGRARMMQRWHAAGVPLAVASEFADTLELGTLPAALTTSPESRVVVLEGCFGAGKSLAAERQHHQDIAAARTDAQAPVPVHLQAKHIEGDVIDAAIRAARPIGDPAARGVALVLDGLDEPGPIRGKELLDQALSWTATTTGRRWRILLTTRPGLEVDASVRRFIPELDDDETSSLIDRLGGDGRAVRDQPAMVRSVVRWPLFAIIAATLQRDREPLPSSPVAFLEALVTRALRDVESAKEERAEQLLRRLAAECVNVGGLAAASDVGSPAEVQALLGTRLVVRRGDRHLAFALPVLEQYFAGQALLADGVPVEVMQSVELLDRWRYGLAMAIASGGWKSVHAMLEPLLHAQPGVVAWAVHEAIPRNVPEGEGPWTALHASVYRQLSKLGSGNLAQQVTASSSIQGGPAPSQSMPA